VVAAGLVMVVLQHTLLRQVVQEQQLKVGLLQRVKAHLASPLLVHLCKVEMVAG
jgi:hypothetical protein